MRGAYPYPRAGRLFQRLDGILQEVDQDLLQPHAFGAHRQAVADAEAFEFDAVPAHLGADQRQRTVDDGVHRDGAGEAPEVLREKVRNSSVMTPMRCVRAAIDAMLPRTRSTLPRSR